MSSSSISNSASEPRPAVHNHGIAGGEARIADGRSSPIWFHPAVHIVLLIAVVLVCFGRTITGYFLADDFGHIGYISSMFNGHWDMFWPNFTGNFMQISAIKVYRPSQLLCEMIDWMLFGANATGWYALNLTYFAGCAASMYLVARRLFRSWGAARAGSAALLASLVFALNPLRCESVSWMVGRVDVVACMLCLLSLLAFLAPRRWWTRALSLAFFAIAMTVKEMPVCFPVAVAAASFFGVRDGGADESSAMWHPRLWLAKFKSAMLETAPWWIVLAVYFCIRRLSLGTFGGGYANGIGGGSLAQQAQKWLDPDTAHRIFFPFNFSVMPEPNVYSSILFVAYSLLVALFVLRLLSRSMPWRTVGFSAVWMATCAVPIYQLWGIGYDLEGGRFYYFLTVPLSILLSILALAPMRVSPSRLASGATALGAVVLALVAGSFFRMTAMTNASWVNAGKEVRNFRDACVKLADSQPDRKFAVLGVPMRNGGAHQILNGTTMNTLLNPPFAPRRYADRFFNFEPVMFSPAGLVNASRLRAYLCQGIPLYVWNGHAGRLERQRVTTPSEQGDSKLSALAIPISKTGGLQLSARTVGHSSYQVRDDGTAVLDEVRSADGICVSGLSVDPMNYDFLEFDAKFVGGAVKRNVRVSWANIDQQFSQELFERNCAATTVASSAGVQHVSVNVSHAWRWFTGGTVGKLIACPDAAEHAEISGLKLLPARLVAPALKAPSSHANGSGIVELQGDSVVLETDVRSVPNAVSSIIQVSKPDCFFDNFETSEGPAAVFKTLPSGAGVHRFTVSGAEFSSTFTANGFYQLRARCLDSAGHQIGEFSDLVTLHVTHKR